MVYCRLLKNNGNKLTYAIGSVASDITGELVLYPKQKFYNIKKQPQKGTVYEHFIDKMLRKYQKEFDKGIVPPKMSYEI
jgi:hypothetical protein